MFAPISPGNSAALKPFAGDRGIARMAPISIFASRRDYIIKCFSTALVRRVAGGWRGFDSRLNASRSSVHCGERT